MTHQSANHNRKPFWNSFRYLLLAVEIILNLMLWVDVNSLFDAVELDSPPLYLARVHEVKQIQDQNQLVHYAAHDDAMPVRKAALKRLSHERYVLRVALSSPYPSARYHAVKKLTHQASIALILTSENDRSVRLAAIKAIKDESIRHVFLSNGKNIQLRAVITPVISNVNDSGFNYELREQEMLYLIQQTEDQLILKLLLFNQNQPKDVRLAALAKIIEPDAIKLIARYDPNPHIRYLAIRRIDDESFLKQFAIHDSNFNIRRYCIDHVNDPVFLKKLLHWEQDTYLRTRITAKLDRYMDELLKSPALIPSVQKLR